jgi:hypothetical protein
MIFLTQQKNDDGTLLDIWLKTVSSIAATTSDQWNLSIRHAWISSEFGFGEKNSRGMDDRC